MTEDTTTPAPSEPVAGPVQRPVGRLEPEREELRATLGECEAAGEQAGRQGLPFGAACPYTFDRAGVDQWTFDAHWRPRLDAWFAGWDRTRPPRPKAFHPRWHKTPNAAVKPRSEAESA